MRNWVIYTVSNGEYEIVKDFCTEQECIECVQFYGQNARYGLYRDIEWRL